MPGVMWSLLAGALMLNGYYLDYLAAGKDEPFVRWFAGAMAWAVLDSDSRCCTAVCNCGWDCSIHYSLE